MAEPILSVTDLKVHFGGTRSLMRGRLPVVRAVDGVSFRLEPGETLGIVGESGCGKSTLAMALMGLVETTAGRVDLDGAPVSSLTGAAARRFRQRVQIVFQDPASSLNPRQRVRDIIAAPLVIHGRGTAAERRARVSDLMAKVGLRPDQADNFPHQFSGGQKQRIGIARALALGPDVIICDEPVSALDVSVQGQILNLLRDLQDELGLSYVFISHDLGVVRRIAERVAVMYMGRIVEIGETGDILSGGGHPYTERLITSRPGQRRKGGAREAAVELPSASQRIEGCAYRTRCPLASAQCATTVPALTLRGGDRMVACHNR